jgi:hypothetical protein
MFGTEMAILEDQSLDFDSSDQTLDRNPRNLKIYLIQLTFTICCWPLWPPFFFSSFLFWVKIPFLQFSLGMDYRIKANTPFGIYFFMGLLCRVSALDCFHICKKSVQP